MSRFYMVRTRSNELELAGKGRVALGWSSIVIDPSKNREELLDEVTELEKSIRSSAKIVGRKRGEVNRFLSIEKDDYIVTPCRGGFYIGRSLGTYEHDKEYEQCDLANQMHVKFVCNENGEPVFFSRDGKNTALSAKLGARGFCVLEFYDEYSQKEIETLYNRGKDLEPATDVIRKESEYKKEFINYLTAALSKYTLTHLNAQGRGFEKLIAELFSAAGYTTSVLAKTIGGFDKADADVMAFKKSGLGCDFDEVYFIQAKHHSGSTDDWGHNQITAFRKLIENSTDNEFVPIDYNDGGQRKTVEFCKANIKYVLITSAKFLKDISEDDVILIDGEQLAEMLYRYIDDIDDSIRGQLGIIRRYEFVQNI